MSYRDEHPVDLSPLVAELDARAARITEVVSQRIAESRGDTSRVVPLVLDVRRRLARAAIPCLLGAAASVAVVLMGNARKERPTDAFLLLMLEGNASATLVAQHHDPAVSDVLELLRRLP